MAELTPADPSAAARTRARRTLIGSAILALTAVVVVPLVIDSKPKPWGDGVKLNIPKKDSTFDTPLPAPAAPVTPAVATPSAAPATSVPPTASPPAATPTPAEPPPKPVASPKAQATAELVKPTATPAAASAPAAKAGKVVLQAGAFTAEDRIKAIESQLRKAGYSPYREEVPAKAGTVTRIRFNVANEDAAQKAITKLAASGITPKIVAP
jgi:DedD protein